MKVLGMTIGEFSALISVICVLIGWVAWLVRNGYKALKKNIVQPLVDVLEDLKEQMKADRDWVRERHGNVVKRLDIHERQLNNHHEQIVKHNERIRTLFKEEEDKK